MPETPKLKRSLSLTLITLYGLGTTIGAGIYVLVGKVAERAGLFTPTAFLLAGLLAGVTAFAFAELSSRYPKSAGEALYVREGFGSPRLALVVGLLVVLTGIVSAATITLGAVGYLLEFVDLPRATLVVGAVIVLGGLAAAGISESVWTAAVMTVAEIAGLAVVTAVGLGAVPDFAAALPRTLPPLEFGVWAGILGGTLLAFYAFIGFEDMVNVAEEVVDAPRRLPRAIVLTLILTVLLYVSLTLVAVLAVPVDELAASEAPLAFIYERSTGEKAGFISLIAIFATANGALIQVIMASRVLYGLSKQGALPPAFGRVNSVTRTPVLATVLISLVIAVLAAIFPIEVLAETTSAITLTVFTMVNLALLAIKRRDPHPQGVYLVPPAVPLVGAVVSAAFLVLEVLRHVAA